ncbi:hypothetical protein II906_05040, partial [bacterium]|nr:hypothetical protein [bacterium]
KVDDYNDNEETSTKNSRESFTKYLEKQGIDISNSTDKEIDDAYATYKNLKEENASYDSIDALFEKNKDKAIIKEKYNAKEIEMPDGKKYSIKELANKLDDFEVFNKKGEDYSDQIAASKKAIKDFIQNTTGLPDDFVNELNNLLG